MLQALPPPEQPPAIIVVTGEALPESSSVRAYDVQTIRRQQLANAPSHNLEEVLRQVPGLQLFRRSDSTSGHPTSQGVTLRSLGGNASSRALLILDGVPQSDPFGGWINWGAYDAAGLERVHVVRGGGSVTFGPGALAGTIELSSLAALGENGSLEAGSRESVVVRGYMGDKVGKSIFTINAQAARSSGFVPVTAATRGSVDRPAPYNESNLRARWIAAVSSEIELQAGALVFADIRERGVPFTDNRTRGADASLRLVGNGPWQWSATFYRQWRNFRSSFASVNEERTVARRVALQDSVPSRGLGGSLELRPPVGGDVELRIGADARSTAGESRELYAYVDGEPMRRRIAGGESSTRGVFADATWTGGALILNAGARLDRWDISAGALTERLIATGLVTRHDQYPARSGTLPTARFAGLFDVGSGVSIRSATYLGWRLPTLNELFRPFRVGADATAANAMLEPEKSTGAEAGISYRRGQVDVSLTGFVNRLSDSIANVTLGRGPGIFPGVGFVAGDYRQRLNIDGILVRGVEATAEARRGPWFWRIGGTYAVAEVEAGGAAVALDRLRPAQTPSLSLTGGVAWESRGRAASLLVRHIGAQFEDDQNQQRLPPATTFDAFLAWPVSSRVQIIARGENLMNEAVIAGISDGPTIERATPRTLWIGVRFGSF